MAPLPEVPNDARETTSSHQVTLTDSQVMEILEHMSDAFYSVDEEWRVTYVNRQTEMFWGRSRSEVIGQKLWELFPTLVGTMAYDQLMLAARERRPVAFEYLSPVLNRWISVRAMPGGSKDLYVYYQDISERKASEIEPKSREMTDALLAAVVRSSGDAIIGLSPEGVIESWNPAAARIFGYAADEVVGHSKTILAPPERTAEQNELIERVRAGLTVSQETVRMAKDGRRLNVILNMAPIKDAEDRVVGISATMIDITERKQAEEALRRSEERYRAISESGMLAIAFFNLEGEITIANDSFLKLMGYTRPEFEASRLYWSDFSPPEWKARASQAREEFLATGKITPYEREYMRRDGTRFWGLFGGVRLQQSDEGVAFVMDITARKQAEAQLRLLNETLERRVEERTAELTQINRELDEFAYVASHDLKAPLRVLDNLSSWIEQDAGHLLPPASREHLAKLQARIQRMTKLLDDLLAYSRAGRLRHPLERVEMNALILDIVDILAPPPGFTVTLAETLPVFVAERVPLEMALRNLIENSIKHHNNPSAGRVVVSVHAEDNWMHFSVKDNGPGIDPRFHKRIFDIFQTLKPHDQGDGSGVGLTVVKKLVEMRGGTVQVESNVGEGCTIHFTWPRL